MYTQGPLYIATSHTSTHKQKTGLWTWPITTHYSYQTLIFHSVVEVETHITSCPSVGSMKQLGFVDNDSVECLSSKPHTVVPGWPFWTGIKKLMPNCTATSHEIQHYPHPNILMIPKFHLNGGHTDWVTVTVLMCELQFPVTGCSGHSDHSESDNPTP